MREFSIVHISDLHITSGNTDKFKLLIEAVKANIKHLNIPRHNPILLLVTGDTVDTPSVENVKQAQELISTDVILKQLELFEKPIVIAGNHDTKKHGILGRNKNFIEAFDLGPIVKPYNINDLGLQIVGVDSTRGVFAQGSVSREDYVQIFLNKYKSEGSLMLFALHHHPLPLAAGENHKVLGLINDEPLMYLKSPAGFLQVVTECGSRIVLHGHRHVPGLIRYSLPKLTSAGDKQWSSIYVISCPSSTGHDSNGNAGFNILSFKLINQKQFVTIHRYIKTETSPYEEVETDGIEIELDGNYPWNAIDDFKLKFKSFKKHREYNQDDFNGLLKDIFESDVFQVDPQRNDWDEVLFIYKWTGDQILNLENNENESSFKPITDSLNSLVQCVLDIHSISKDKFEKWWKGYEEEKNNLTKRGKLIGLRLNNLQASLIKLRESLASCNIEADGLGDYRGLRN